MSPISNASRLAEFGTGIGTAGAIIQVDNLNQRVGIGTTNPQATLQVGTGITMYADAGIISATTYSGNWGGAFNGTTATFSGAVNLDATTDSTSSSTGALIVDGGVGIAKNVYIGAGLSVAGTLTYEDVTNVDSVGLITAKSGVNITGGEFKVGTAVTIGSAGVATFSAGLVLDNPTAGRDVQWQPGSDRLAFFDNTKATFGDGADLTVYHDGSHSYITNSTGDLKITDTSAMILASNSLRLRNGASDETYLAADNGAGVELYFNNGKTFETTANGVTIYDDGKNDEARLIVQGGEGNAATLYLYADDGDDNADKWRMLSLTSGALSIQNYASGSWETSLYAVGDAQTALYFNDSTKFQTTNDGTVTTGISTATDFFVNTVAAKGLKNTATGQRFLQQASNETRIYHASNAQVKLTFRGTGDTYRGAVNADANGMALLTGAASEEYGILCVADGTTKLYHDNVRTFETIGAGISIYGPEGGAGQICLSSDEGDDNADKWRITKEAGNSSFRIQNYTSGSWETSILATGDGSVELYEDNTKRFETTTTGVNVSTTITATGTEGVSASLYLIADDGDDNGDGWRINSNQDDNDLTISNNATGSYVDKLTLLTSGNATFTGSVSDSKGDLRQIIYQNKTSGYTLVAADAGKAIHISTGGVTINNSLFSAGDAVSIINNSGSDQTITQGSGVTLYNTSDGSTGNKTLTGRGMATVWFSSASVGYISGNI